MSIDYRTAGVDIDEGDAFVESLPALARKTHRPEVMAGIGGFASLFRLDTQKYRDPVLVSGTDGVGTKLLVAIQAGRHRTVGIDLVAMCVNDVVTTGAEPLFFLDYFATGRLDRAVGREVVAGIAEGCVAAGCALVGGETAEMPGMYSRGHYDLAGFAVGVVERERIIDGRTVLPGDVCIGVASSGLHSNGYSLVRHVLFEREGLGLDAMLPELDRPLADALLEPTRIYVKAVNALLAVGGIGALAHITGGGISGNLERVLPDGTEARLDRDAWSEPAIFGALRRFGVPAEEMDRTFNLGLGLIAVCRPEVADACLAALHAAGERATVVGHIVAGQGVTIT